VSDATHAYVGIKPCGCLVAAIVDRPELKGDIAKETGSWLRRGWTVDRLELAEVRPRLKACECPKPVRAVACKFCKDKGCLICKKAIAGATP
jgi:hypothetical protein